MNKVFFLSGMLLASVSYGIDSPPDIPTHFEYESDLAQVSDPVLHPNGSLVVAESGNGNGLGALTFLNAEGKKIASWEAPGQLEILHPPEVLPDGNILTITFGGKGHIVSPTAQFIRTIDFVGPKTRLYTRPQSLPNGGLLISSRTAKEDVTRLRFINADFAVTAEHIQKAEQEGKGGMGWGPTVYPNGRVMQGVFFEDHVTSILYMYDVAGHKIAEIKWPKGCAGMFTFNGAPAFNCGSKLGTITDSGVIEPVLDAGEDFMVTESKDMPNGITVVAARNNKDKMLSRIYMMNKKAEILKQIDLKSGFPMLTSTAFADGGFLVDTLTKTSETLISLDGAGNIRGKLVVAAAQLMKANLLPDIKRQAGIPSAHIYGTTAIYRPLKGRDLIFVDRELNLIGQKIMTADDMIPWMYDPLVIDANTVAVSAGIYGPDKANVGRTWKFDITPKN